MGVLVSKQNGGSNPFKPNKVSNNGHKSLAQAAADSSNGSGGSGTSTHLFDFKGSKRGGSRRQAWGEKDKDAGKNLL